MPAPSSLLTFTHKPQGDTKRSANALNTREPNGLSTMSSLWESHKILYVSVTNTYWLQTIPSCGFKCPYCPIFDQVSETNRFSAIMVRRHINVAHVVSILGCYLGVSRTLISISKKKQPSTLACKWREERVLKISSVCEYTDLSSDSCSILSDEIF